MITILIGLAVGLVAGCLISDVCHRAERADDADLWTVEVDQAIANVTEGRPKLRAVPR